MADKSDPIEKVTQPEKSLSLVSEASNFSVHEREESLPDFKTDEPVLASINELSSFHYMDLESRLIQETKKVKRENRRSFLKPVYEKNPVSGLSKGGFILGSIAATSVVLALTFLVVHFHEGSGSGYEWPALGLLLLAILLGLIALFVGINGYKRAKKWDEYGKGLGITGFVFGIVSIALGLLTALAGGIGGAFRR